VYSEVVATWKTSCPRLTIWEDAADCGYVARETIAGVGLFVTVTEDGEKLLRAHGRAGLGRRAECDHFRAPQHGVALTQIPGKRNIHASASILRLRPIIPEETPP
jgi:hypothetical protein